MENRTYRYFKGTPLYPFGYGLSYGKLVYKNAAISQTEGQIGDIVTVTVEVENQGAYEVHEAAQLYVKDIEASTRTPNWQLRGIQNVDLQPGATRQVTFELGARDFALITEDGKCVVEPGAFQIAVGGQQPDARSAELTGRITDVFELVLNGKITEVEY